MTLSGFSFGVTWVSNLEISGLIEGDLLYNSEGNRVGNKLGISDVEVLGITLGFVDRRKIGSVE